MGDTKPLTDTNEPIEKFYAGKSVLVTGATGFLGKVFLEKLIYSCPKIETIYILTREKNKLNALERTKKILDLPIFNRIKSERPKDLEKIIPIYGDLTLTDLGLGPEAQKTLKEKVSVVFHLAANVKFNELIQDVIEINVEGTKRVLNLCQHMGKLEAFVYMSTAFCHTDQKVLEEIIYPAPATIEEFNRIIGEDRDKENWTEKLICGRPNVYTFTKAVAETLVSEEHSSGRIPAIIIRPSIVTCSAKEPLPGWLDHYYGATGLIIMIAKGLNRVLFSKSSNVVDFIPVDYVSNLSIVAAARYQRPERSKVPAVYNICSSAVNPVRIGTLFKIIADDSVKHKFYELWHPTLVFTQSRWVLKILTFILQIIPAFIIDCLLRLRGKPPRFMKLQGKLSLIQKSIRYFTSNSWVMKCQRSRSLYESLSKSDRLLFPFDPVHIDWDKYIRIYNLGIRRYLIK